MLEELLAADEGGIDASVLVRSLATFLALTSDGVLVFDASARIVLANNEAERLFGAGAGSLVGMDVRDLFPTASPTREDGVRGLPFSLDGTTATVMCRQSEGRQVSVSVRCDRLRHKAGGYVLIAFTSDPELSSRQETERLVGELSRANRRLSGTLRIVLETLDAPDVGMLFERVLDEISETLDAWGTLAYVVEEDGFRLRGVSDDLEGTNLLRFIPNSHPLAEMALREARPLRLRVMRPTREDLRKGSVSQRHVVEEESLKSVVIGADQAMPFASFVTCPVWFGGHALAMLVVGWRHEHNVADDDVRLLEAVAEYLSVQLAGAFAAMRAQHADHLEALLSQLREQLMTGDEPTDALVDEAFALAAQGVGSGCVRLVGNPHQRTTLAKLVDGTWHSVPFDLPALLGQQAASITDVAKNPSIETWLAEHALPTRGLLVALSAEEGACKGYLLVRSEELGPFEAADLSFVHTFVEDVCAIDAGARARTRDKRISQALQRGMRNELQVVEGITAESFYCSATEEAYVGGDFYDLIRLPNQRACAIMGDVSGKGVEAASVSSAVKTALGAYAWEGVEPARMVSLLNDFLLGFSRVETFATLFVGIIDVATGTLTYCSAGHPPALLVRSETGELMTLGVQSGVVGAFEGMAYRNGVVQLDSGDILLLYTDGTTEARNPEGAFFGEDGLRDAVVREAAVGYTGICERLLAAVEGFAGGNLGDDVALVSLRYDGIA